MWFSVLSGWFTLRRGVAFNCYLSTSPAARGWSGLYLCLGCYTPIARGAWSVVGRCVDCGMRRRGRSAAVERVDPPVGSLFWLRAAAIGLAVCWSVSSWIPREYWSMSVSDAACT